MFLESARGRLASVTARTLVQLTSVDSQACRTKGPIWTSFLWFPEVAKVGESLSPLFTLTPVEDL